MKLAKVPVAVMTSQVEFALLIAKQVSNLSDSITVANQADASVLGRKRSGSI